MKILLVEDDDYKANAVLNMILEMDKGHEVVRVATMSEGVESIRTKRYQVLVTDWMFSDGLPRNGAGKRMVLEAQELGVASIQTLK